MSPGTLGRNCILEAAYTGWRARGTTTTGRAPEGSTHVAEYENKDSNSEFRLKCTNLGIFDKQGLGVFVKLNELC